MSEAWRVRILGDQARVVLLMLGTFLLSHTHTFFHSCPLAPICMPPLKRFDPVNGTSYECGPLPPVGLIRVWRRPELSQNQNR